MESMDELLSKALEKINLLQGVLTARTEDVISSQEEVRELERRLLEMRRLLLVVCGALSACANRLHEQQAWDARSLLHAAEALREINAFIREERELLDE